MSATVLVSAGEPSGDAHAAALVRALRAQWPDARVVGVGGPALAAEGVELLARFEDFSAFGFIEVVGKIPAHLRLLRAITDRVRRGDVAVVILCDYPGFHLRVAAVVHRLRVPVFYYIAPALWAWHESRVHRVARDVTKLGVILPFEESYFRERGVDATYVGHPLLDRPALPERAALRASLGLDPLRAVLGLFPGSRAQETRRLWPVFREAAHRVLAARPDVQVIAAATPSGTYPDPGPIRIIPDRPRECFAVADAAISKSGTTTLEAALAGTPQVIAYRVHPLTYLLARRLAKVPWMGMVNLIAGRLVAPEFVQWAATPAAVAAAVLPLLDPSSPERRAQLEGIAEVRRRLGGAGAAERAAALARSLVAA